MLFRGYQRGVAYGIAHAVDIFLKIKLWLLAFCMPLKASVLQGSLHPFIMSTTVLHDAHLGPFSNVWKYLGLWTVSGENIKDTPINQRLVFLNF